MLGHAYGLVPRLLHDPMLVSLENQTKICSYDSVLVVLRLENTLQDLGKVKWSILVVISIKTRVICIFSGSW